MNFLCDQCKQKYHVADEKVRGKAVTRFKCKKCGHVIELRMSGASEAPSSAAPIEDLNARELPPSIPPPAATGIAAPRSAPGVLPARAPRPTGTGLPTARLPGSPAAAPRPAAPGSAAAAATARAPLPSRVGSALPKPAPAPMARGATGTGLPTAGALGLKGPSPARPLTGTGMPAATARASGIAGSSPLRSGLAGRPESAPHQASNSGPPRAMSSASMLLNANETGWYAGVRDVPVGPLTRSELALKIESGEISHDSLVWREGLDDWRPLRVVDELSDLVRSAARKVSDGLMGSMGARRNDSGSGKVVPMPNRLGGGIAPTAGASSRPVYETADADADEGSVPVDDEPTRMTALADLVAKAEQAGLLTDKPRHSSPPSSTQSTRPATGKNPSVRPAAVAATTSAQPALATSPIPLVATPAAAVMPARGAAAKPSILPVVGPNSAGYDDPTQMATSAPVMSLAPPAIASPAVASVPPATASASVTAVAAPSRDRRLGGLPIGAWVMMVGFLVTGVALGLLMRAPSAPQQGLPATTQARTMPDPVVPLQHPVGQEIALDPNVLHPAAPVAPASTPVAETANVAAMPHAAGRVPGIGRTPSGAPAMPLSHLSAAQRAALAQLDQGGGDGPGAPIGATLSTSHNEGPSGLGGVARANSVRDALGHSGVIASCWNLALRRNPAHPAESLRIQISVLANGHASAIHAADAQDPELANCIETRARGAFYGMGAPTDTESRFNLTPGQ